MAETIAIQRYRLHGDAFRNITDPMTSRTPASLARKRTRTENQMCASATSNAKVLRAAKVHLVENQDVLEASLCKKGTVSAEIESWGPFGVRAGSEHMPAATLACACIIDGGLAAALSPPDIPGDPCTLKKMAIPQEVGVVLGARVRV